MLNFCRSTNEDKNAPIYSTCLISPATDSTVPVCADTSWWRGQALTCGHSYTNSPCRNTDEALLHKLFFQKSTPDIKQQTKIFSSRVQVKKKGFVVM